MFIFFMLLPFFVFSLWKAIAAELNLLVPCSLPASILQRRFGARVRTRDHPQSSTQRGEHPSAPEPHQAHPGSLAPALPERHRPGGAEEEARQRSSSS